MHESSRSNANDVVYGPSIRHKIVSVRYSPDEKLHFGMTLSYCCPFTLPPPIEVRTFLLKPSLFDRRSSAASLLSGSEAFGSRKRNCNVKSQPLEIMFAHRCVHRYSKPERFSRLGLTYLKSYNHRIQIKDRLPILP